MFPLVAAIFLIVPIIEIYLLIQVGQVIGAGWTIFLVVATAVIGVALLRIQGLSTLNRAQQKLQQNELPAREILEGMGLVVAGALLLTPGFFTDTIGFLLLFPPSRVWLAGRLLRQVDVSSVGARGAGADPADSGPSADAETGADGREGGPVTLEGEYERKS